MHPSDHVVFTWTNGDWVSLPIAVPQCTPVPKFAVNILRFLIKFFFFWNSPTWSHRSAMIAANQIEKLVYLIHMIGQCLVGMCSMPIVGKNWWISQGSARAHRWGQSADNAHVPSLLRMDQQDLGILALSLTTKVTAEKCLATCLPKNKKMFIGLEKKPWC